MGGPHDFSRSGNYSIPVSYAASVGAFGHETAHGFGLQHAFDTARSGDFFNDQGPGAYGDYTDIMSWANSAHSGGRSC